MPGWYQFIGSILAPRALLPRRLGSVGEVLSVYAYTGLAVPIGVLPRLSKRVWIVVRRSHSAESDKSQRGSTRLGVRCDLVYDLAFYPAPLV
jgi:hypothetical protein